MKTTLRSAVARQMVRFHEIPLELAEYHVGMMDRKEVRETFLSYWRRGMELSAASPTKKSCPDFYQVFGSATTTAGLRPSIAFPAEWSAVLKRCLPLPESEAKNLVRDRRLVLPPRDSAALPESEIKNLGIAGSETALGGGVPLLLVSLLDTR